jgi:hypothetical protein
MPTFTDYKDLDISMEALEALGQGLKLFWAGLEELQPIIDAMKAW